MLMKFTADRAKYGISLLNMTQSGLTGETSRSSSVPVSFSLTMETAVIIEQMSIRISPITPGTKLYDDKLYDDFMAGLYISCTTGVMDDFPSPAIEMLMSCCSCWMTPDT